MKTILFLLGAMLSATITSASGNLNVNFKTKNAELAVVEISNTKISNFEINFTDERGAQLYLMKTQAPVNEFKKNYDFSQLEDGTYWYSVKIDKEKVTKKLNVSDGKIEVLSVRKDVEPVFIRKGDKLNLSMLNFQQEDTKVYVYDNKSDELLAESDLGNGLALHRALDLSALRYGTYNVVVANDAEIYEYRFEKE